MKSTFTLKYEESGDRTLVFRYVPAPRGNRYRLVDPNFSWHYDSFPELKDYIVQEVKPLYVAETDLFDYARWVKLYDYESYRLPFWHDDYNKVTAKISNLKNNTKVPIRLPTEHELEWSMLGGEDFLYPGCTNKEKVVKQSYIDAERLRPNMFGLIDLFNDDPVCTSTLTKEGFTSSPIPSKEGDAVICRIKTFEITQRWSKPKKGPFRIRLYIDADWVNSNA